MRAQEAQQTLEGSRGGDAHLTKRDILDFAAVL